MKQVLHEWRSGNKSYRLVDCYLESKFMPKNSDREYLYVKEAGGGRVLRPMVEEFVRMKNHLTELQEELAQLKNVKQTPSNE